MLPVFPDEKIIELTDREAIETFTKQFPPYNDFEFMSLWTYNPEGKNAVSILNDNLVIKIQDFITGEWMYSFLGTNRVKETIEALITKSKEDNLGDKLYLVPEIAITSTENLQNYFSVIEDPNSFDYILSVQEIADLQGGKYYDKRNLVNRFKKTHPEHVVIELSLGEEKTRQDIEALFSLWQQQKGRDKKETEMELTAIERMFDLVGLLPLYGIGVYIQEKLIGFSTYHVVQDKFAIMSFEKGDTTYQGIYPYLNQETAKRLRTMDCEYINYEQDLGIPSLKKAKMLWRPVFYLKKYIVSSL